MPRRGAFDAIYHHHKSLSSVKCGVTPLMMYVSRRSVGTTGAIDYHTAYMPAIWWMMSTALVPNPLNSLELSIIDLTRSRWITTIYHPLSRWWTSLASCKSLIMTGSA